MLNNFVFYIIVLILILLIGYMIRLNKIVQKNSRHLDSLKKRIDDLLEQSKQRQDIIRDIAKKIEVKKLEERIGNIEKKINQQTPTHPALLQEVPTQGKNNPEKIYFGLPVKGTNYFKDEEKYAANDDLAVFMAEITGNKGTFCPYEFGRIRNCDIDREVLKSDGDVSQTDSNELELIEKGKIHKENDKWIVDQPVVIRFKK